MDNLVLVRVVASLDASLRGAVLTDLRLEGRHRFRLRFEIEGGGRSIVVSLEPVHPWLGRPAGPWGAPPGPPTPFSSAVRRTLCGRRLIGVDKPPADRTVHCMFADHQQLVLELATHRANMILLDAERRVRCAARHPPSARARLAEGRVYRSRECPEGMLDPFNAPEAVLERWIAGRSAAGQPTLEVLRRGLLGVGTAAARCLLDEAAASGEPIWRLLRARLDDVRSGRVDPVILAPEAPWEAAGRGMLDPTRVELLPWLPQGRQRGRFAGEEPPATAGLYYDSLERQARWQQRVEGLWAVLEQAIGRLARSEERAREDLAAFRDPERLRRQGEALLAGLAVARRAGDQVVVPDPYGPGECVVPARPGWDLPRVAAGLFDAARRAGRGRHSGRRRLHELEERRHALEALREGGAGPDELERSMRELGIPVGLEPDTRAGRAGKLHRRPRLEGVRLFVSSSGESILVGKTARENQRLTFRLAGPDDWWFHAAGHAGAHVILRSTGRGARPDEHSLVEAAGLAAWFSGARDQAWVDVHWTRRKHVRRPRGAPPGTVHLKRFATLRVVPRDPSSREGGRSLPGGNPRH